MRDNRRRTEQRIASVRARIEQGRGQQEIGGGRAARRRSGSPRPRSGRRRACGEPGCAQRRELPGAESAFRARQAEVEEAAAGSRAAEQAWRVEETRREHADKLLAQHSQRRARLARSAPGWCTPMRTRWPTLEQRASPPSTTRSSTLQERAGRGRGSAAANASRQRAARATATRATQRRSSPASRRACRHWSSCKAGSATASSSARGGSAKALDALPRLWQGIDIEAGWEDALESVLRERLDAVELEDLARAGAWFDDRPPGKVALFDARRRCRAAPFAAPDRGLPRLIDHVRCKNEACRPLLDEWLARVYLAEDGATALAARDRLESGRVMLSPAAGTSSRATASSSTRPSPSCTACSRASGRSSSCAYRWPRNMRSSRSGAAPATTPRARCGSRGRIWTPPAGGSSAARQERHRLQLEHLQAHRPGGSGAGPRRPDRARAVPSSTSTSRSRAMSAQTAAANVARYGEALALARSQLATTRTQFARRRRGARRAASGRADRRPANCRKRDYQRKTCAARLRRTGRSAAPARGAGGARDDDPCRTRGRAPHVRRDTARGSAAARARPCAPSASRSVGSARRRSRPRGGSRSAAEEERLAIRAEARPAARAHRPTCG